MYTRPAAYREINTELVMKVQHLKIKINKRDEEILQLKMQLQGSQLRYHQITNNTKAAIETITRGCFELCEILNNHIMTRTPSSDTLKENCSDQYNEIRAISNTLSTVQSNSVLKSPHCKKSYFSKQIQPEDNLEQELFENEHDSFQDSYRNHEVTIPTIYESEINYSDSTEKTQDRSPRITRSSSTAKKIKAIAVPFLPSKIKGPVPFTISHSNKQKNPSVQKMASNLDPTISLKTHGILSEGKEITKNGIDPATDDDNQQSLVSGRPKRAAAPTKSLMEASLNAKLRRPCDTGPKKKEKK